MTEPTTFKEIGYTHFPKLDEYRSLAERTLSPTIEFREMCPDYDCHKKVYKVEILITVTEVE